MFGLFKSKEQRALEAITPFFKGMITGALEEHGIHLKDFSSVDDLCAQAAASVGRIMIARLRESGHEISGDGVFIVGLFVMGAANYTTQILKGDFEATCTIALLSYYRENEGDIFGTTVSAIINNNKEQFRDRLNDIGTITGATIDAYNKLVIEGKVTEAILTQIAQFFEKSGDAPLANMMRLFDIVHTGVRTE